MKSLYEKFTASTGVCTDSRAITEGCLYFALKGENFNGNLFAEEALAKGAAYAIIDEPAVKTSEQMLVVDDVLSTLQQLANYHRRTLGTLVIGITGSNGKTTTKELIASVLGQGMQVVATRGNLNNHIGVPLTLLSIKPETDIAVVEMGANHPGEIAFLCSTAEPDYGYITSIGKAHLEGFGSFEGVVKTKGELFDYLKAHHKTIFLNAKDTLQAGLVAGYEHVYTFGDTPTANVHIQCLATQPVKALLTDSSQSLTAEPATRTIDFLPEDIEGFTEPNTIITSHLRGDYNFTNVAAAIAIGRYFKLSPVAIKHGIEQYVPNNNRNQFLKCGSNTVVLDAYNANPSSMAAAIGNVVVMEGFAKKVLILGDMFELGTYAAAEHQRIVDMISEHSWAGVYLIGEQFSATDTSYPKYKTFEAFAASFPKDAFTDTLILIKGSRGMALERIITEGLLSE